MDNNDPVQHAQQTMRTVRETFNDFALPASASRADGIAMALLRAAMDDAYATTLLLSPSDRPLIGPASALLRSILDKLKRAAWAMAAPAGEVETAFDNDKFPGNNDMVTVIETNEPANTFHTKIHKTIGPALHAFVHGGRLLIECNIDGRLNDPRWLGPARSTLAPGVAALAIEMGLAATDVVTKYDEASALRAARVVSALVP